MTPLAAPETTDLTSSRGVREIRSRWRLAEHEDGATVYATLRTVHHGRPRYRFVSTLRVETEQNHEGITVTEYGLLDRLIIATQDAARYSAKGAHAAHAVAVHSVQHGHPSDEIAEGVRAVFDR